MSAYARRIGFVAGVAVATLFSGAPAFAQASPDKLPIIGVWRINLEKSSPAIRRARTEKWTTAYEVENGGIRHSVYDEYPPKNPAAVQAGLAPHDHTYWFKLDGKQDYKDPEGPNGEGQTVAMWLADQYTIFRQRQTKGVDDERVLYRVSPDGKTLTWTVWSANKPNPTGESNVMVWDRVK
jgi:hypothetical protein